MMKLKWYWILLIAILIVILIYIVYKNYSATQSPAGVLSNTPSKSNGVFVFLNRNTQDDVQSALTSYENPLALTDSNGVTAIKMGDVYLVNGLQAIKCCHARSVPSCKCTGWTWKASGDCTDPGCGGAGQV